MMKSRELETRVADLENAIQRLGKILVDESLPIKKRVDMALGITFMYDTPKEKQA